MGARSEKLYIEVVRKDLLGAGHMFNYHNKQTMIMLTAATDQNFLRQLTYDIAYGLCEIFIVPCTLESLGVYLFA